MRPTKLSRFCEGLMEAGWLAALVLAPLFFNSYSSRTFEPDKIALVRSIALIIAAAWVVKLIEERGLRWEVVAFNPRRKFESFRQLPLALPVAALLAVTLLSTLLSLTPRISFWGSYTRLQGTYTTLAYLVVFAAVAVNLRRKEQVERLVNTIIYASLPVSLYGVMQRLHLDPLPWGEDTSQRITSTLGNAIFIAAYLIMIVPFTAMRVAQTFRAILREQEGLTRNIILATVYVFTGAMQLMAIWFSGSRGPWLGLLSGMFFWAILMSLAFRQKRVTLAVLGLAGLAATFLITLNIPNGPLEPLRQTESLERLGRVFEVQDGTSKVRVLIWEGAVDLILPHDPIQYPGGRADLFNLLRPIVGYGPEAMFVAYNRFYPPEIAHYEFRTATPDRSHNETFDALVTTGLLGLVAYLAVFAAVIYYGLKWLGLITPQDKWLYVGLYAGGGAAGAVALVAWRGPAYFGVGLPFGMLIGLLAYLAWLAMNRTLPKGDEWKSLVITALLGGIVAHFTEIHFGIAIASTRLHFWAYAGLLVVVGWVMSAPKATTAEAAEPKTGRRRNKVRGAEKSSSNANAATALFSIFINGLVLVTMSYNFLGNADEATTVAGMLAESLTKLNGTTSFGMLLLFVVVWFAGAAWNKSEGWALITLAWSATVWIAFTLYYLGTLSAIASREPANFEEYLGITQLAGGIITGFTIWVMALLAFGAVILVAEWPFGLLSHSAQMVAAPALFAIAIVAGYFTNTRIVQADMAHKLAQPWDRQARWEVAIPLYEQAINLAPEQDQYYLFLGRAYLEKANRSTDRVDQETILNVAQGELQRALALNPLNPDHNANLARLLQRWAHTTTDPNEAEVRLSAADGHYANALMLSPNSAALWNEWARFDLSLRQDYEGAMSKLEKSLSLDDQFNETYALLGDYWSQLGAAESDPAKQQADYEKAVNYYQQSIAAEAFKPGTQPSLTARLGLAAAERALGNLEAAIASYEEILTLAGPEYNLWAVQEALAEIYLEKGDKAKALEYANQALAAAPEGDKARVQELIERIGN
jgi:tetratricopeptide (TPR) repeat protein/O-antigen ligase